jgi:hypothetical protein
MDAHLTRTEHHNRCMKKARGAEARLQTLTKTYGVVPESIRAVQVICVQAVTHYGSELWWYPSEASMRDDLQLHRNREARSILGALPMTPRGGTNERLRASNRTSNLRVKTAAFRSEARKRVKQQTKETTPKPLFLDVSMQRSEERAPPWPDHQRHELAGPRRRVSGQAHHTG